MAFHPEGSQRGVDRRSQKERRVRDGQAHAALVFDGDLCVGWCQFGSPDELPRIKFGAPTARPPAIRRIRRITCFFVDKSYRHKDVAAAALKGALLRSPSRWRDVESSPEDVEGRKVSNSFLYNATVAMFEQQGFVRTRQLGKNNWLVTKKVRPKRPNS